MAALDPSAPPVATGPTPFPGTTRCCYQAWSRPDGESLLEAVKHKLAEYGWSCPEYDGGTTGNMKQEWKVLITNAKQKPGANALGPRPKTVKLWHERAHREEVLLTSGGPTEYFLALVAIVRSEANVRRDWSQLLLTTSRSPGKRKDAQPTAAARPEQRSKHPPSVSSAHHTTRAVYICIHLSTPSSSEGC